MKNIIKLITEEIEEFDFLDTEKEQQNSKFNNILNSKSFTNRFINDVAFNFEDKIKFDKSNELSAVVNDEEIINGNESLDIDYDVDIKYLMNGKYLPLAIGIEGQGVPYELGSSYEQGDHMHPSYSNVWFENINWDEIKVKLYDKDGTLINEELLEGVDLNTKERFIRNFIEPLFTIDIEKQQ